MTLNQQSRILNRRYCYYHVRSAILLGYKEHLGPSTPEGRKRIKKDLEKYLPVVHLAKKADFLKLFNLMLGKFTDEELRQYLRKTYSVDYPQWHFGDHFYVPTCKTQLEGYDSHLKNNEFERVQLLIKDFLKFTMEIISCESSRRNPLSSDKKLFSGMIPIDRDTINSAIALKNASFPTCRLNVGQSIAVICQDDSTHRLVQVHNLPRREPDIETYSQVRDKHLILQRHQQFIVCSCVYFAEKNVCAHSYLFECANDLRGRDAELKLVRVVPKRKRGRPKKMAAALVRQS